MTVRTIKPWRGCSIRRVVYQDNDATKDMNIADIVRAIRNLVAAGVPIAGQFISLNAWRYEEKKA